MSGEGKKQHLRDEETLKYLAKRLKELRVAAGMSQQRLANEAGIEQSLIGNIETAKGNPTVSVLAVIAKTLGVPLYELFKFEE
ncbi:MAG TPA: helix-turn-helix transcriptional regulator [Fluviicola sp.]|nr:helix-turn-helix transcriptional regulator [Fluviicola sp.]